MKMLKYLCLAMVASATSLLAFGNSHVDQSTLYTDDTNVVAAMKKKPMTRNISVVLTITMAMVPNSNANRGNRINRDDARRFMREHRHHHRGGNWGGGYGGCNGGCEYESYDCGCGGCGDSWGGYGGYYGYGRPSIKMVC